MDPAEIRPVEPTSAAKANDTRSRGGDTPERTEAYRADGTGAGGWSIPGGRYRVLHEIGRGGMGVVFRAYDTAFERTLAIKVLRPVKGAQADAERRFVKEAKITGQLQHPGIPPAHEVGRLADGRPYFSMKLIEGRTLTALLSERASPQTDLPRFLKVFEQIAQTIGYAHMQCVIHRDLKPVNVMVGAFGEVQVMDWGVAKRLHQGAAVPAQLPGPLLDGDASDGDESDGDAFDVEVASMSLDRFDDARSQNTEHQTHPGAVVGTYSCMSPEQARGEIAALDERCDVFGLGAILCAILTGRPPYRDRTPEQRWQQAREADLSDAWARLDASGADRDLVQLAKACLAPEPADRPANAGRVAEEVTRHLASVQARLQETRVARAQAEVKAQEASKKRRLAVGLAAAVVTLVVGASLVGWWYVNDQAQREREEAQRDAEAITQAKFVNGEVGAALDEAMRLPRDLHQKLGDPRQAAVLMSELHRWQTLLDSAHAAWKRADTLAAGGRELLTPDLRQRLATMGDDLPTDELEWRLAVELDRIRFEASTPIQNRINLQAAAPKLGQAFRKTNFDVETGSPGEVGHRIGASTIRLPLVASLDFWALVTQDSNLRSRFLEAARTADPDPWRDRYRQAELWFDPAHLQALARDVDPTQQSPQLLAALAQRMRLKGVDASGLLQRALIYHPHDFWLFFELGLSAGTLTEQIGAYRAALAVRPDSGIAYYVLGDAHLAGHKLAEAIACYRRSIELVPDYAGAHNNLGLALDEQGNKGAALACFRRAVELNPKGEVPLSNLGGALQQLGELEEAAIYLKKSVELDPNRSSSHSNLAAVLRGLGKLDEAVTSLHKAIALDPKNPFAWCNLGHTLTDQGKFVEGLKAMRTGHELGLTHPGWTHPSALWVKETEQFLKAEQKLEAVLKSEVEPGSSRELLALALICSKHKRRPATATRFFAAAFHANPLLALPTTRHRYSAGCAAARAGLGEGIDAVDATVEERIGFRNQAHAWLSAELTGWNWLVETRAPVAAGIDQYLRAWQTAPELANVREAASLGKLPPDEREAWHTLWTRVAALRDRAAKQ